MGPAPGCGRARDVHHGNLLPLTTPRAGAVDGHALVDPGAFLADPAYDLGVLVRGGTGLLAAMADATGEVRSWCRLLSDETGVDEQAIWEWGPVERVTTSLHLSGIGLPDRGRPFLDVAARLVGPPTR